jgi:hypothetical protein
MISAQTRLYAGGSGYSFERYQPSDLYIASHKSPVLAPNVWSFFGLRATANQATFAPLA